MRWYGKKKKKKKKKKKTLPKYIMKRLKGPTEKS